MNTFVSAALSAALIGTMGIMSATPAEGGPRHRRERRQDVAVVVPDSYAAARASFSPREVYVIREYYAPRHRTLPPGLQKKFYRTGQLPPGWQKRLEPFPVGTRAATGRPTERLPSGSDRRTRGGLQSTLTDDLRRRSALLGGRFSTARPLARDYNRPVTINDAHCHFFSSRFFERLAPDLKDLPPGDPAAAVTGRLGWEPPGTPQELADRWAGELDRHGVGRTVLIASVPEDEASVAAAVARHPGRFVGFFMLDPTREDAPARIEWAVTEMNLRCVCLFPAMHRCRMDDSRVLKIFELVAAHPGTAVFVHCGVLSIGVRKRLGLASRFDIRLGDPLALQSVASAFPHVPVIIPHFGAGLFREALMAADMTSNIYLDTSSSNSWIRYDAGLTLSDVFQRSLDVVGPDRLLFGTDSSFFPRGWQRGIFDAQKAALEAIDADQATQQKIFGGNFDRLFA